MSIIARVVPLDHLPTCHAIRHQVFVIGQRVPVELDLDGLDSTADHVLAWHGGEPVGTARIRWLDDYAKVERVAVLEYVRGLGIGRELMVCIHRRVAAVGRDRIELNAQVQVVPFYERLGYVPYGDIFVDAGIDHRAMRRVLRG